MSVATTQEVRIDVASVFVPERSAPDEAQFFFAYTVRISNEGAQAVQLLTRHWIIMDGGGHIEEVRGPGVVGQQPVLRPGESFEYTSACPLRTPHGTMYGSYQMIREDGVRFDAEIAPFGLAAPTETPSRWVN